MQHRGDIIASWKVSADWAWLATSRWEFLSPCFVVSHAMYVHFCSLLDSRTACAILAFGSHFWSCRKRKREDQNYCHALQHVQEVFQCLSLYSFTYPCCCWSSPEMFTFECSLLALSPNDVLPAVYLWTNKISPDHDNMVTTVITVLHTFPISTVGCFLLTSQLKHWKFIPYRLYITKISWLSNLSYGVSANLFLVKCFLSNPSFTV